MCKGFSVVSQCIRITILPLRSVPTWLSKIPLSNINNYIYYFPGDWYFSLRFRHMHAESNGGHLVLCAVYGPIGILY